MFCYLFGLKRAGLRLTALDKAMCPRFRRSRSLPSGNHLYRYHYRVVTSQVINRTKLGHGSGGKPDHESGLFNNNEAIQQLQCGDVALLKGEIWDGNEGGFSTPLTGCCQR